MAWFRRNREQESDATGVGFRNAWSAEDSRRIVDDCCADRVAAVVVCWPQGTVAHGQFLECGAAALTLRLTGGAAADFPALAVANVSFNFRGRARVFLAPVLESCREGDGPALLLRVRPPDEIAGAEARLTFRVPIAPGTPLESHVRTDDGDAIPARPVNLSVSGALVEFPPAAGVELAIGSTVTLRLDHEGTPLLLEATVRRREGHRYGLHFASSAEREDVGDSRVIRELIERLERRWTGSGS